MCGTETGATDGGTIFLDKISDMSLAAQAERFSRCAARTDSRGADRHQVKYSMVLNRFEKEIEGHFAEKILSTR
jgi:DNA-binding NtrC family response regulator